MLPLKVSPILSSFFPLVLCSCFSSSILCSQTLAIATPSTSTSVLLSSPSVASLVVSPPSLTVTKVAGIVTKKGLWSFSDPNASSMDFSKYKLRFGDFAHSSLALVVFAVIALLDSNTVSCFYPALETEEKTMMTVLPTVIGGLASFVFMLFPNNRHGIGYPATQIDEEDSK